MPKRSLPPHDEPWQTFRVTVRIVRGRREVRAAVELSHVTGIVGATGVRPRPLWEGTIALRSTDHRPNPEDAAMWAQQALERAFPTLF